ncbi:MAG: hypothetical protein ACFCUN_09135 [Hyphomicrobiaceae bacterium]
MRHALGVLGVLAAGVLLAVSAAMNWRFGYQLGTTELDGIIYGSASAAADCLKALVPFFIFAAIRNKMWSQAAASAVVWLVVTAYSLTSALGHAALNRHDTAGQRAAQAATYATLQADLSRTQERLSWVPQHRPAATVQSELSGMQTQRPWVWSSGCTEIKGAQTRKFCGDFTALQAELGAALEAEKLEARIADTQLKLAGLNGAGITAADPQAQILAKLSGAVLPGVSVEDVQTALAVFIALLLEVGSSLGMYIAFSVWRMGDQPTVRVIRPAGRMPKVEQLIEHKSEEVFEDEDVSAVAVVAESVSGANDNRTGERVAVSRPTVPESDVERFQKERIEAQDGSSLTATELYEDYCAWCDDQSKEPLALPTFGREFAELGIQKAKIAGRVRYIGISLRSSDAAGVKKPPVFETKAA